MTKKELFNSKLFMILASLLFILILIRIAATGYQFGQWLAE
jgi:hypothetical protein